MNGCQMGMGIVWTLDIAIFTSTHFIFLKSNVILAAQNTLLPSWGVMDIARVMLHVAKVLRVVSRCVSHEKIPL